LTLGAPSPESVGQGPIGGREGQRHRIDAITLARRRRAVWKHVPLVRAAPRADDFGPHHAEAGVADIFEMLGRKRRRKARPPSAAFEFRSAFEQRQSAQPAGVEAWALLIEKQAAERTLCAVLEQDVALFVAEVSLKPDAVLVGGRRQIE